MWMIFTPAGRRMHLLCVARNAHVVSGYVECVTVKWLQNWKNGSARGMGRSGFEPLKALSQQIYSLPRSIGKFDLSGQKAAKTRT